MQALIEEIQRRKVFTTFLPYLGFVWLFLQVVSIVVPMLNLSPLVNTFTVVILFAGIPVMLYVSWHFNFTTSGFEAVPDADSGELSGFGVGKWIVFISITLASGYVGISYFYAVKVELAKTSEGTSQQLLANSIAVIPFKDNSAEQDQSYLAKGLAEEITLLMGNASRLRVIDTHSVNVLLAQGLDPISVARKLKVDTALTGTVRTSGSTIRLRVELINVKDGKVLWAESYTRDFSDIFALESIIARSSLNTLIDGFIAADEFTNPSVTGKVEAYQMYLKGREAFRKQSTDGLKDARKYFEQSIKIAPEFSKAYVALADTIILSADRRKNFDILAPNIAKTLAQNYLAKALVKTQTLPGAFVAQGKVFELGDQLENALAAYDKAISINPSLASAHIAKYKVLKVLGRHNQTLESLNTALELNPESLEWKYTLGVELTLRRQLVAANTIFTALVNDYPDNALGYAGLGLKDKYSGTLSNSFQSWSRAFALTSQNEAYFYQKVNILLTLGLTGEAVKLVDKTHLQPYIYLHQNNKEKLSEFIASSKEAYPQDISLQIKSTWFEMLSGNYADVYKTLALLDDKLSDADKYTMPACRPAIDIAWSLLAVNKSDEGQVMIDLCETKLKAQQRLVTQVYDADYLKLRIAALNDDNAAEDILGQLIESGFRETRIVDDPLLANVKELPEIQLLLDGLQSLVDLERRDLQIYLEQYPINNKDLATKSCTAGQEYRCWVSLSEKIESYDPFNMAR